MSRSPGPTALLAVEEGPRTGGWAAGLLGPVAEHGLHDLDDAWLLATGELPIPYSPTLEDAFIPDADAIAAAVRERAGIAAAMPEIVMPRLSDSMEEGTIIRWLKQDGERGVRGRAAGRGRDRQGDRDLRR